MATRSFWDIIRGKNFELPEMKKVTFIVKTKTSPENDSLFIVGNQRNLGNWNPGRIRLLKNNTDTWKRSFFFERGTDLEYKITRGSWSNEALNDQKKIPENFELHVKSDTTIIISIPFWKDIKTD